MEKFPKSYKDENHQIEPEGLSKEELFSINKGVGLTYNDFILLPSHIAFGIDSIDVSANLTNKIRLNTPFVSSPMDTVTESDMAIGLALQGGIGVIHCNCSPEKQAEMVAEVKRYNNGFISRPATISGSYNVSVVCKLMAKHKFSSFPVTQSGQLHSKLLGMVTKREIEFVEDESVLVSDIMVPRHKLYVGKETYSLEEAREVLKEKKVNQLPIVDQSDRLVSLICKGDIMRNVNFPHASKDKNTNQLLVAAAVTTLDEDFRRVRLLVEAGVNLLVIDSSNGDSIFQLQTLEKIKRDFPQMEVMAGNVVTVQQAARLIRAGADAIRVGQGSGSICTTQRVCGVGRAQATAVFHIAQFCRTLNPQIPVIADGGIKSTGDIVKALSLGASAVMMGGMFAGVDESPGEMIYRGEVNLKKYRGMASAQSQNQSGSSSRYLSKPGDLFVAQGVSGEVMYRGSLKGYVPYLVKGVKHGFQNIGCRRVNDLEKVRFEKHSFQSQREGDVHDLYSYEMVTNK